ncbi:MAG: hypothetical protein EZS28_004092 [Streblomastix strix]|uniref:Uncharacterized protein n=1 Tax=Streblomastix strix TaxID=222440 RepID=A0A5J4WZ29_9EUKA|nr:MAG: hypothetical protein EZS28_004092 [Streblomastix strix]
MPKEAPYGPYFPNVAGAQFSQQSKMDIMMRQLIDSFKIDVDYASMSDEMLMAAFKTTKHFIDNEKILYCDDFSIKRGFFAYKQCAAQWLAMKLEREKAFTPQVDADERQSNPRDDSAVRSEQMKLDRRITLPEGYRANIPALGDDFDISETDVNDENYELGEQMMEVVYQSPYTRRTVAKGPIDGDYVTFRVREMEEMVRLTKSSPSYLFCRQVPKK